MSDFFQEALYPVATIAISIAVPAVVGVGAKFLQKLGVDIDAKNREALQSALQNAAMVAVSRAGTLPTFPTAIAVDYVKSSVPGAIKRFDLDQQKIEKLLEPHIAKAVNEVEK